MAKVNMDGRIGFCAGAQEAQRAYRLFAEQFRADASAAGFAKWSVPGEWILAYIERNEEMRAFAYRAIRFHYRHNRRSFPLDDRTDLAVVNTAGPYGRVRFYYEKAVSEDKMRWTRRAIGLWENFADQRKFDPAHPQVRDIGAFVMEYLETHTINTLEMFLVVLRRYLRKSGGEAVLKSVEFEKFITGVRWASSPADAQIATINDVRKLVGFYHNNHPLDIRDRVAILLCAFGATWIQELLRARRSDVTITDRGVELRIDNDVVCVGHLEDPELDIHIWMQRWLDLLGEEDGPLFPSMSMRGGFTSTAVSLGSMGPSIWRAARAVGLKPKALARALRRGAAITGCERIGYVRTAHLLRLKRVDSLERYVPNVTLADKYVSRRPNGRARGRGGSY